MIDRHVKILELLSKHKKMEVTTLSDVLHVSQVTIRKDLGFLEDSGIVIREHGYAVLNTNDDINNRLAYHYHIKQKIATEAIRDVMDGETVMIESGSCCALVAIAIAQTKKKITIITNSAFIASYIRKVSKMKIILLGGEYQPESQVMVGPMTRQCAENFFVDKLFIGIDGFSEEAGFTGNDYMRCEAVRDMAKQADKVIVVSESEKFNHKGNVSLLPVNRIYAVITDEKIPFDSEDYLIQKQVIVKKSI